MKKIFFVLFVSLFAVNALYAENDGWFVTAGGGVNTSFEGFKAGSKSEVGFAPAVTFNVGKWFSPYVGFQVGYDGFTLKNNHYFPEGVSYNAATAAVLWNASNSFGGYDPERKFAFVPYAFGGYVFAKDNSLAGGLGISLPIRLGESLSLVPDVKASFQNDRIYSDVNTGINTVLEVTLGLKYSF